jgi:hypothetical protein
MHVSKNNPRKIISLSTQNTVKKDFNHDDHNSCFITWIFFSKIVCLLKRFTIPYIGKKLTFTRLKNQNPKSN